MLFQQTFINSTNKIDSYTGYFKNLESNESDVRNKCNGQNWVEKNHTVNFRVLK